MPVLASAKTLPTAPSMKTHGWTISSNVAMSVSPFTRQQQSQEWGGECWKIKVTLPPMALTAARDWLAFFASLHGPANPFMLGPVGSLASPAGVATGTPLVSGSANGVGQFSISTKGWTPSQTGIIKQGTFFQVGNHIHMFASTEDSDGSGLAAFDIWPSLREAPADGDAITIASPKGMFRLASNDVGFDIDEAQHFSFGFDAVEVLT